jgi:hypothetical protein
VHETRFLFKRDPLAVGPPSRLGLGGAVVREPFPFATVGVDEIELGVARLITEERLIRIVRARDEDDLSSVRRPIGLAVVGLAVRQPDQAASVGVDDVDLRPAVAAGAVEDDPLAVR